ncbi:hypothetical protein GCM10009102_06000 [Sphingomonas insulae]|uniref:Uncharacterized protein n=1 Tax=Sphingomonas insulae TaxID=424800 RepID=A0ABN1HND0_9SPHN
MPQPASDMLAVAARAKAAIGRRDDMNILLGDLSYPYRTVNGLGEGIIAA